MTTAYPLCWPEGVPRTKSREKSKFKTSLEAALKNVETSLRLFGGESGKEMKGYVLSSNVSLGVRIPDDPGIAVWFQWDGMQLCIAIDRYHTPAENLQAIHHIIEARRTELRHGTLHMIRATFTGFRFLPSPPGKKAWHDVLGVPATASREQIEAAFREKAKSAHPDAGGSNETMAALNAARATGLAAL